MAARSTAKCGVRILGLCVFSAIVTLTTLSSVVMAQNSTLRQEVQTPSCIQPEDCEMTPPSIESVVKNGGKPLIIGRYDAVFTRTLRVIFGSRVYELSIDDELTVHNGEWRLDLTNLSPPLIFGDYGIIIETVGYDNKMIRIQRIIMFNSSEVDAVNKLGSSDRQQDVDYSHPLRLPYGSKSPYPAPSSTEDARKGEAGQLNSQNRPQPSSSAVSRQSQAYPVALALVFVSIFLLLIGKKYRRRK